MRTAHVVPCRGDQIIFARRHDSARPVNVQSSDAFLVEAATGLQRARAYAVRRQGTITHISPECLAPISKQQIRKESGRDLFRKWTVKSSPKRSWILPSCRNHDHPDRYGMVHVQEAVDMSPLYCQASDRSLTCRGRDLPCQSPGAGSSEMPTEIRLVHFCFAHHQRHSVRCVHDMYWEEPLGQVFQDAKTPMSFLLPRLKLAGAIWFMPPYGAREGTTVEASSVPRGSKR